MIKINGKYIRNIPEQVGKNKRDIFTLDSDLTALEVKVNEALAGVFHYKGSVATYADLPASDNEVGDVYNVIDTGKNYAWDGSAWDDLGGLVDLSNYYTKSEADAKYVDLTSSQTISGFKRFSGDIGFGSSQSMGRQGASNVYLTSGTGSTYFFDEKVLRPSSNNLFDLGNVSTAWKDLYLSGSAKLYTTNSNFSFTTDGDYYCGIKRESSWLMQLGTSQITSYKKIIPSAANTYDLGASGNEWKDLYLSGKSYHKNSDGTHTLSLFQDSYYWELQYDNTSALHGTGSAIYAVNLLPSNNNQDLGSSSAKWRNCFVSQNLSDGTNTATVADIAALITYAKAQGWIS